MTRRSVPDDVSIREIIVAMLLIALSKSILGTSGPPLVRAPVSVVVASSNA